MQVEVGLEAAITEGDLSQVGLNPGMQHQHVLRFGRQDTNDDVDTQDTKHN